MTGAAAPPPRSSALPRGLLRAWTTARRLLDLFAATLCIWTALFHTPPGALLRDLGTRLLGRHHASRPLLSYYGGGTLGAELPPTLPALPRLIHWRGLSSEGAMGYGALCAMQGLDGTERAAFVARAQAAGLSQKSLGDAQSATSALAQLLGRLRRPLGSDDLAMLALFCGDDAARYAGRVSPAPAELPTLARLLPPSLCPHGVALAGQALAIGTAAQLTWPVLDNARITSVFGEREHPTLGGVRMHRGVDLAVPVGTPVHAAGRGTVRRASEDAVNGRCVVLDHGHGVISAYLHNEELLVSAGDDVWRGQVISHSGSSGRSTGPHLHYQLEIAGVAIDPLSLQRGAE